jgi:hypothetical protein
MGGKTTIYAGYTKDGAGDHDSLFWPAHFNIREERKDEVTEIAVYKVYKPTKKTKGIKVVCTRRE